jgi:hypothetical protein
MSGSNPTGHSGSILEFSEDISNAKAPEPLPIGQYTGEIIGAQWRVSATTGNTYAQIIVRVPESNYPVDHKDGEPDGTVLMYNRLPHADTPRARYAWRLFCEKVRVTPGRSIDLNDLLGRNIIVDVVHQEYEGEQRASIARILEP